MQLAGRTAYIIGAGRPQETTGLALFLAVDGGDDVTGQTWMTDGGLTLHWGGA